MKLVLIRHSKSLVNPDVPINTWGLADEGIALAKKMQENKAVQEIQVIYSSLQPKALETAILATKNRGVPLRTDDRLTEITSFTKQFVDLITLEKNTKDFYTKNDVSFFGGETQEEALKRFNQAIEEIVAKEKEVETIGIASHGATLTCFAAQFIEKDPYEIITNLGQPDVALFDWTNKKFVSFFGETQ